MKILETSWGKYAIVTGIECRLTTINKKSKDTIWMDRTEQWVEYIVDDLWIYRDTKWFSLWWSAILIPKRVERVENKMRSLWYTEFDYDASPNSLAKCFKS